MSSSVATFNVGVSDAMVDVKVQVSMEGGVYPRDVFVLNHQADVSAIPEFHPRGADRATPNANGSEWIITRAAAVATPNPHPDVVNNTLAVWAYYVLTDEVRVLRKRYRYEAYQAYAFSVVKHNNQRVTDGALLDKEERGYFTLTTNKMKGAHPVRLLYKGLPGKTLPKGTHLVETFGGQSAAQISPKEDAAKSLTLDWSIPIDGVPGENTMLFWAVYEVQGDTIYYSDSLRYSIKGKK